MCRYSLSIFILLTLCVAHNKSDTSSENLNANTNDVTPSDTPSNTPSNTPADTDEGSDQGIKISEMPKKERNVSNRIQKTFLRNPNYISANKLFEKESKKSYIREQYKKLPLPHPGFLGNSPDRT